MRKFDKIPTEHKFADELVFFFVDFNYSERNFPQKSGCNLAAMAGNSLIADTDVSVGGGALFHCARWQLDCTQKCSSALRPKSNAVCTKYHIIRAMNSKPNHQRSPLCPVQADRFGGVEKPFANIYGENFLPERIFNFSKSVRLSGKNKSIATV